MSELERPDGFPFFFKLLPYSASYSEKIMPSEQQALYTGYGAGHRPSTHIV